MLILLDINKLKSRARDHGIPLRELCKRAGVNPSTLGRLGRQTITQSARTLTKLNIALAQIERERREAIERSAPIGPVQETAA